jgi:5-methylcytosine-specific restriction endonuclease McrA
MSRVNYKKYLQSPHWYNYKQSVYRDKPYYCYLCQKREKLELHHITYKNLGNENIDDVIYLCHKCHLYATFSKEKEKLQKWFERTRKRNLKKRQYMNGKTFREINEIKRKNRLRKKHKFFV